LEIQLEKVLVKMPQLLMARQNVPSCREPMLVYQELLAMMLAMPEQAPLFVKQW
jgi:hypothetical protein